MERITIYIEKSLLDKINEISKRLGINKSSVIKLILSQKVFDS